MSRCVSYCSEFKMFERRIEDLTKRKEYIEEQLFNLHREYEMVADELCTVKDMYRHMMCDTDCYLGDDCTRELEPKEEKCEEDDELEWLITEHLQKREADMIKDLAGRFYQPIRTE